MFNWELFKHPVNWLVLGSMALIVFYAGHLILTYAGSPASDSGPQIAPNVGVAPKANPGK